MSAPRIESFEAFWPFYLGEHSLPATRWMHFFGSSCALALALSAVLTRTPFTIVGAVLCGYAFAWVSHFFLEKNRPATFTYPLWSLAADWKMWALMATGRLRPELERFGIRPKA